MPLHDWTDRPGWKEARPFWTVELLDWVKPRLPAEFHAYTGTSPAFAIDVPAAERPNMGVRQWGDEGESSDASSNSAECPLEELDEEVAVAALEDLDATHARAAEAAYLS